MTAQNNSGPERPEPNGDNVDPLGPIHLPKRSKVGARAMALVGTIGLSSIGAAVINTEPGWPFTTIEH
ncbi:hypothetical protein GCM10029976_068540 [Kribbella albertanoniae]|uniref:Uncharacterized protein n=1 Tax=Kribbella albertanoniae TaxID=1266829 RepID=A0A4R4PNT7_9ACTN|nr:hypothetical protein [Kribbella albertanoniae]TDC23891.1 hypothetical protein E1261_27375 [Kribbella albertanoniae]